MFLKSTPLSITVLRLDRDQLPDLMAYSVICISRSAMCNLSSVQAWIFSGSLSTANHLAVHSQSEAAIVYCMLSEVLISYAFIISETLVNLVIHCRKLTLTIGTFLSSWHSGKDIMLQISSITPVGVLNRHFFEHALSRCDFSTSDVLRRFLAGVEPFGDPRKRAFSRQPRNSCCFPPHCLTHSRFQIMFCDSLKFYARISYTETSPSDEIGSLKFQISSRSDTI